MKFSPSINEFLRTYVKEINNSNAAVFAGAGMSQPAGYVNWKELLREAAEDIQLDVDQESDIIALAQYHVNEFGGRAKINQILIDEFTKRVKKTENHAVLSSLPINTYWTTNYDQLIEYNLEQSGKKVDVKIEPENLTYSVPGNDAVVYKMHGDKTLPHKAVLTKDDYDAYDRDRELFTTALRGDLVSKTFLFIGFSFDDPNLAQILTKIRFLLDEDKRTHYCFMKKVDLKDFDGDDTKFAYATVKQELKIRDLMRYGIKVLLVDEYDEITKILHHIVSLVKRRNIFVSGSAKEYGQWDSQKSMEFATSLSKSIIKNEYNIVSGFGLGIGSCIVSGALEELYLNTNKNVEERLKCRPFPQTTTGQLTIAELWTKYRQEMLSNVGISVFIFGNKIDDKTGDVVNATGMMEEFTISVESGSIPIPVGVTGYASKDIWDQVMQDFDKYVGIAELKPLYTELGDIQKTPDETIDIVIRIINQLLKQR